MKFEHLKQFGTPTGATITMKALVTIHDEEFVECYEDNTRHKASELIRVLN